ncbi:Ferric reduction oxidase 8 [Phytophthora cinnamomi]|uniref:Ferric reduction oxidase 8 n=1 Tax=Phytophthora cinnamomi TaxID=4785 RepID=UPI00355A2909|nr:Ferric reduction oxidase 8 [Phytophthora cinnamomi]
MILVFLLSAAWTFMLAVIQVLADDMANMIMNTSEFDNGNFWLLPKPKTALVVSSTVMLALFGAGYTGLAVVMLFFYRGGSTNKPKHAQHSTTSSLSDIANSTNAPAPVIDDSGRKNHLQLLIAWADNLPVEIRQHYYTAALDLPKLIFQTITLYTYLDKGFPVPIIYVYSALLLCSWLAVGYRNQHYVADPALIITRLYYTFDLFFAVFAPLVVLIYFINSFKFDRAAFLTKTETLSAGTFDTVARLFGDPSQISSFCNAFHYLQFSSGTTLFYKSALNLLSLYKWRKIIFTLIHNHRERQLERKRKALLFFFSDGYATDVSVTIGNWYGYPTKAADHEEMVLPTFFFLFCFIPMVVAILLFEFLRHFSVRRITSSHILRLTRILLLKPRIMGRVLHKSYGEFLFLAFIIGGNIYEFQYFYRANIAPLKEFNASVDMTTYLQTIALTFGCLQHGVPLPSSHSKLWLDGVSEHFLREWKGTWVEDALPCFKNCKVGEDGQYRWTNTFGTIALLCFLAIGVTSTGRIRRKMYDVFYCVHHLFIIATIFVVLHWNSTLAWLFPSVMMYTACRPLSSSNAFTPVPVREFTTLSSDVVKVVLERSTMHAGEFKVGNFVYLNVPAISKLQWHHFTISSSPQTSPNTFTILLKSLGDWTQELVKYPVEYKKNSILPTVYMDGFYGASLEFYDEYATVCLIGGGIGVTPVLAILEDQVAKLHKSTSLSQKVFFVFTFRELSLLEEIHPL